MLKSYYVRIVEELLAKTEIKRPILSLFRTDRRDVLTKFLEEICSGKNIPLYKSSEFQTEKYEPYTPFTCLIKSGYASMDRNDFSLLMDRLSIFFNHRELFDTIYTNMRYIDAKSRLKMK